MSHCQTLKSIKAKMAETAVTEDEKAFSEDFASYLDRKAEEAEDGEKSTEALVGKNDFAVSFLKKAGITFSYKDGDVRVRFVVPKNRKHYVAVVWGDNTRTMPRIGFQTFEDAKAKAKEIASYVQEKALGVYVASFDRRTMHSFESIWWKEF